MSTSREQATDILIIGGGTAGFGAAIAAARQGAHVSLLEGTSKIGGVMAFCPGMPWGGGYPVGSTIGGVFEELTSRMVNLAPPAALVRPSTLENFGAEVIYDHEAATFTMFEMLEEAGVNVHLNTIAGAPTLAGNRIVSVEAYDRRGPLTFRPKMVIDCSGDGETAAKAGVPYTVGNGAGDMMGVTLSFTMINADWTRVFADDDPYFERYAAVGVAEGRLHPDLAKLYLMKGFHEGAVFCNTVHIRGVDGTDPAAVARATQEGRRRCRQVARFLTESVPGFEKARMTDLGPTVGVRETRRLEAMHRITGKEIARATKFEDGIVACDNPVDDVMRGDGAMSRGQGGVLHHSAAYSHSEDGGKFTVRRAAHLCGCRSVCFSAWYAAVHGHGAGRRHHRRHGVGKPLQRAGSGPQRSREGRGRAGHQPDWAGGCVIPHAGGTRRAINLGVTRGDKNFSASWRWRSRKPRYADRLPGPAALRTRPPPPPARCASWSPAP